jgi:ATP-dependent Clp protease protease subunit
MKDTLNNILVKHTGKGLETIQRDTDRDFFMTGFEAQEYGIVDHVITDRNDLETITETEA